MASSCSRFADKAAVIAFLSEEVGLQATDDANNMVSACLLRALLTGHLQIPDDVWNDKARGDRFYEIEIKTRCPECRKEVTVGVEDLIDQNDDPSYCECGPIECKDCQTSWFLTGLCCGEPKLVDFREHKHSEDGGPDFGECLFDFNYCHCPECRIAFDRGIGYTYSGNPCPNCGWPDNQKDSSEEE